MKTINLNSSDGIQVTQAGAGCGWSDRDGDWLAAATICFAATAKLEFLCLGLNSTSFFFVHPFWTSLPG